MNVNHGKIAFFGIEVPINRLRTTNLEFRDECGHNHLNNVKKKEYKFCEECGEKRYYINMEFTDLYRDIENKLLLALVEDVSTDGNTEKKYYCVMQWFDSDHKIDTNFLESEAELMADFKAEMKKLDLWKLKRFGLYTLQNVVPTTAFYKNENIRRGTCAKPAIFVDAKINDVEKKDILEKLKVKNHKKTEQEKKRKEILQI